MWMSSIVHLFLRQSPPAIIWELLPCIPTGSTVTHTYTHTFSSDISWMYAIWDMYITCYLSLRMYAFLSVCLCVFSCTLGWGGSGGESGTEIPQCTQTNRGGIWDMGNKERARKYVCDYEYVCVCLKERQTHTNIEREKASEAPCILQATQISGAVWTGLIRAAPARLQCVLWWFFHTLLLWKNRETGAARPVMKPPAEPWGDALSLFHLSPLHIPPIEGEAWAAPHSPPAAAVQFSPHNNPCLSHSHFGSHSRCHSHFHFLWSSGVKFTFCYMIAYFPAASCIRAHNIITNYFPSWSLNPHSPLGQTQQCDCYRSVLFITQASRPVCLKKPIKSIVSQ